MRLTGGVWFPTTKDLLRLKILRFFWNLNSVRRTRRSEPNTDWREPPSARQSRRIRHISTHALYKLEKSRIQKSLTDSWKVLSQISKGIYISKMWLHSRRPKLWRSRSKAQNWPATIFEGRKPARRQTTPQVPVTRGTRSGRCYQPGTQALQKRNYSHVTCEYCGKKGHTQGFKNQPVYWIETRVFLERVIWSHRYV